MVGFRPVDLGDTPGREVFVDVELLSGGTVEWSGRLGPVIAGGSSGAVIRQVPVFRGPLDNLDVDSVTIIEAPMQMLVGDTALATAVISLPDGSTAEPELYWASLDDAVATVGPSGDTTTVVGVAPGMATIAAAAGPSVDTVDVEVLPRVQSVVVTPASATLAGAGATTSFTAEVTDGFGDPAPGEPVTWASSDASVVTIDQAGLATAVAAGAATVTATAAGTSGSATVTVTTGPPAGFDVMWTGAVGTDWADAGNWSTGQVPTSGNDVFVGVAAESPVLTQNQAVRDLLVEAGQSVDLAGFTLDVARSLTSDGAIANGVIDASGASAAVRGAIHDLVVSGTATMTGDLQANAVTVVGALDAAAFTATTVGDVVVDGTLTVPTGSTFAVGGRLTLEVGSTLEVDGAVTASGGCVNNGGVLSGSGTQPCSTPLKTWVGGDASDPTSVEVAANWSPPGVPTAADDVLVPVTGNDPVASGAGFVRSITVADGATIDLGGGTLDVTFDIDAGANGILNGTVRAVGAASILEGALDVLEVSANRTLTGSVTATSVLLLDADLTLGGQSLAVADSFAVVGTNAQLFMFDSNDLLDVEGNVRFAGGSHSNALTEGRIEVGGDFNVTASSNTAFAASGNHWVEFDGTGPQAISLAAPGTSLQRFGRLQVTNTGGVVTTLSDVVAASGVYVGSGATLDAGDDTVSLASILSDPSGGFDAGALRIFGPIASIASPLRFDVFIDGNVIVPNPFAIGGSLTLNNADLDLDGSQVTVSGDLTVDGTNAQLIMTSSADTVDVAGDVLFNGSSHATLLTAGVLEVGGDFTVTGSSNTGFAGTGAHTVVLDGTADQTLTFAAPGTLLQRFFNLTNTNTSGQVLFASDVVVMGAFTTPAGSSVTESGGARTLSVGSSFDDGSDGTILSTLRIVGDLTAMDDFSGDVFVDSNFATPGPFFVGGSLTLNNADMDLGGNAVTVNQDFLVTGTNAQLIMTDPDAYLEVVGDVTFDGASHTTLLSAGSIEVGGAFTVTASSATGFAATGTHSVIFPDGPTAQTVSFANPGPSLQRFQNLLVLNGTSTVEFLSNVVVMGAHAMPITDVGLDAGDDTLSVGGSFQSTPSTSLAELNIIGDLSSLPATVGNDVRVSADFTLPTDLEVQGALTIEDADLTVNGNRLFMNAPVTPAPRDFSVLGSGRLIMTNAADTVDVVGHAVFAGASHDGVLTEGYFRILGGNLTASGSPTAFVGTGNHEVTFLGGVQTVTLSNPSPTGQRFADFTVASTGPVNLATDVFVMDTFDLADGDMGVTASGPTLEIRGTMFIEEATFLGLPVRLVSNVDPTQHQVSAFMVFDQMLGTDTQFYARLPGSGQVPGLQLNNVTFNQAPTTGFYVDVGSTNGQSWQLQMSGGPSPGSPGAGNTLTDGLVIITWPWP